jgi:signal transduction histidine kinase
MPIATTINILLVDDDEEDFIITRDAIYDLENRDYKIEWVSSYRQAEEIIPQNKFHVYLIDYRLGGENGLNLIKSAKTKGCTGPLILMTGQGDMEIDEQAMKAGAADYLVKGKITASELDRSIRYSIKEAQSLEEIRMLNAQLEERVQERTKELFEAIHKLEETNKLQKQAEEEVRKALSKEKHLNELKSQFVTIASHEFRTPLSTILSSASLIEKYIEKDNKEGVVKHSQRIKSSVSNLTGILNDFLSLSKLEEGHTTYIPEEFNIKETLDEVIEEMGSVAKETQELLYAHDGEEKIFSDKNIIKNSLINLISNSIKYSEKGTIKVVSQYQNHILKLSVEDQGIGIPQKDQTHMFNRFYRAQNAGNIQGTGLGLNIVKRYVDLLGGKIYFESTEGKGTSFFIEIPIIT